MPSLPCFLHNQILGEAKTHQSDATILLTLRQSRDNSRTWDIQYGRLNIMHPHCAWPHHSAHPSVDPCKVPTLNYGIRQEYPCSNWDSFTHPLSLMLSVCHNHSIVAVLSSMTGTSTYCSFVASRWQTQKEPIASRTDEDIMVMRKRLIIFPTTKPKLIDWVILSIFPLQT